MSMTVNFHAIIFLFLCIEIELHLRKNTIYTNTDLDRVIWKLIITSAYHYIGEQIFWVQIKPTDQANIPSIVDLLRHRTRYLYLTLRNVIFSGIEHLQSWYCFIPFERYREDECRFLDTLKDPNVNNISIQVWLRW